VDNILMMLPRFVIIGCFDEYKRDVKAESPRMVITGGPPQLTTASQQ
jgi:hypothetical protein